MSTKEQEKQKTVIFNMKKYIRDPEMATALNFDEFMKKRLHKALKTSLHNCPFFFVTNFKFADRDEAPFLFIGTLNSFWKKIIKSDYKRRKEYAAGILTLEEKDGQKTLKIEVKQGKGKKDSNLRKINKILLRRLKVVAEWDAGTVEVPKKGGFFSTTKKPLEQDSPDDKKVVAAEGTIINRIQQEVQLFKETSNQDIEAKIEQISTIERLLAEYDTAGKGSLVSAHKNYVKKLKSYIEKAKKIYNPDTLRSAEVEDFIKLFKEYWTDKQQLVTEYKTTTKILNNLGVDHPQRQKIQDQKTALNPEFINLYKELVAQKKTLDEWDGSNAGKKDNANVEQLKGKIIQELDKLQKEIQVLTGKGAREFAQAQQETKLPTSEKDLGYDPQALEQLKEDSKLPKMEKFLFGSKTYKKVFDAYKAYEKINPDNLDLRRIKLLEIDALIKNWEKGKHGAKETKEINKLKAVIWETINKIANFTVAKDVYPKIMRMAREFEGQAADYLEYLEFEASDEYSGIDRIFTDEDSGEDSYRAEQERDLQQTIDDLEDEMKEWQKCFTNMAGFGTKKHNQKIESIRKQINAFIAKKNKLKADLSSKAALNGVMAKDNNAAGDELEKTRKGALNELFKDPEKRKAIGELKKSRTEKASALDTAKDELEALRKEKWENTVRMQQIKAELDKLQNVSGGKAAQVKMQKILDFQALQKKEEELNKALGEKDKVVLKINDELSDLEQQQNDLEKTAYLKVAEKAGELSNTLLTKEVENITQLAKEAGLIAHKTDINIQKKAALDIASKLIEERGIPTVEAENIIKKLENDTIYALPADKEIRKHAKHLMDSAQSQDINYNDPNVKLKTKRHYDAPKDKVIPKLKEAFDSIDKYSLKGTIRSATALNKARQEKITKWKQAAEMWFNRLHQYFPSQDLDKNKTVLEELKTKIENIEKEGKKVQSLSDTKQEIAKISDKNKRINKHLEKLEKQAKKLGDSKEDQLEKIRIQEEQTKYKGKLLDNILAAKANTKEWEKNYNEITDTNVKEEKRERQGKMELTNKRLEELLTREFRKPEDIQKKKDLFNEIDSNYNANIDTLSYKIGDENQPKVQAAKLKDIAKIEAQIREWNGIIISTTTDEQLKEQESWVKRIGEIWGFIAREKAKLNQQIVVRKDVLFDAITAIYNKVKSLKAENIDKTATDQLFHMETMMERWAKKNTKKDVANIPKFEQIEKWKKWISTLKTSDKVLLGELELKFEQSQKELSDRLSKIRQDYQKDLQSFKEQIEGLEGKEKKAFDNNKETFDRTLSYVTDTLERNTDAVKQAIKKNAFDDAAKAFVKLENVFDAQAQGLLHDQHELWQELERRITMVLQGFDAYESLDNINMPDKQKAAVKNAAASAVARARKMRASGATVGQIEQMMEHMPTALWPDEFIEEMRLWQKAEDLFFQREAEKAASSSSFQELNALINDVSKGVETATSLASDAYSVYSSGKFTIKDENGTKYDVSLWDGGLDNKKAADTSSKTYGQSLQSNWVGADGFKAFKNVSSFITGDVKGTIDGAQKLQSKKPEEDPQETRKRKIILARYITTTSQKVLNEAIKFTDGSDAGKVAKAVMQGVNVLATIFMKGTEGIEDQPSIKEYFKSQMTLEGLEKAADLFLTAGASVSSIVEIFVAGAGVVGAAFTFVADVKAFIKAVQNAHKAFQTKKQVLDIARRADEQGSIMAHPLRREFKTAKDDASSAAVDAASAGIIALGSGVNVVGSAMMLAGEPEVVAAGAATKVAAAGIKLVGKTLKVGKDVYFTFKEEVNRQELKQLLKLARAGDRNARLKVTENSRFYAKAFLAIGAAEGDPIALEYCFMRGMTDKDLSSDATSMQVLKKLFEVTGDNEDERTIGERIKKAAGEVGNFFSKSWAKIKAQPEKMEDIKLYVGDIDKLRKNVLTITANYNQALNMEQAMIEGGFGGNVNTLKKELKPMMQKFLGDLSLREEELDMTVQLNIDFMEAMLKEQENDSTERTFDEDLAYIDKLDEKIDGLEKLLAEIRVSTSTIGDLLKAA